MHLLKFTMRSTLFVCLVALLGSTLFGAVWLTLHTIEYTLKLFTHSFNLPLIVTLFEQSLHRDYNIEGLLSYMRSGASCALLFIAPWGLWLAWQGENPFNIFSSKYRQKMNSW